LDVCSVSALGFGRAPVCLASWPALVPIAGASLSELSIPSEHTIVNACLISAAETSSYSERVLLTVCSGSTTEFVADTEHLF